MPYSTLERMLAAALRQAAQEDRLDVAEYILLALQALSGTRIMTPQHTHEHSR